MYKASVKVSPMKACTELLSHAIKFGPLILLKIVSFTNFLVIIISPFAVQSAPLSLYNLTWYYITVS